MYERIKNPNVPESVIEDEIRKRESKLDGDINFPLADTLANNPKAIFELYYAPSESAYKGLRELKNLCLSRRSKRRLPSHTKNRWVPARR